MDVPFNRPFVSHTSRRLALDSLASPHTAGDGPMSQRAQEMLAGVTHGGTHFLTPSCTHALELACQALDLGPGDEVIVPSYNFPSAATAVVMAGATPVFADVDPVTAALTLDSVKRASSSRTRAIILLHYAGVSGQAAHIRAFAGQLGAALIEDVAHGLGVMTNEGALGSFGTFATYSFHATKNVQCGEGGSLQVNDSAFNNRIEVMREKGTNRARYFRGEVDKYRWVDRGSSWILADPLAAVLVGQLQEFAEIQKSRIAIVNSYRSGLQPWANEQSFRLLERPTSQDEAAHMFYLVAPTLQDAQGLIGHLKSRKISASYHYQPLHSSPAGIKYGRSDDCPVSSMLSERLVRLPLFTSMLPDAVNAVIDGVTTFQRG